MARRSGFVKDLQDADKALSTILPKVAEFAGILAGLSAQPAGSPTSAIRGRTLSTVGGSGVPATGIRSLRGGGSGGGGTAGGRQRGGSNGYRVPSTTGGSYQNDGRVYNTGGASTATMSTGESAIVGALGALIDRLRAMLNVRASRVYESRRIYDRPPVKPTGPGGAGWDWRVYMIVNGWGGTPGGRG